MPVTQKTSEMPVMEVSLGEFDNDMTKKGWRLVSDTEVRIPTGTTTFRFALVSVLLDGEKFVGSEEIRERLGSLGVNSGQRLAEIMFRHRDQIPNMWGKFNICFPNTVWEDLEGRLQIPCISYDDGQWDLFFCSYSANWWAEDVFARLLL